MKNLSLLLVLSALTVQASAQTYTSRLSESTMTIAGTSTLHDWESDVQDLTATCVLRGDDVERASFEAPVKSIKSGTSAMDDNTYKAMDEKNFPKVTFVSNDVKMDGNRMTARGKLTIAGESKTITMSLTAEKWIGESVTIHGSHTFKMSEYGIDPPRAMLGTIRTGDEVTIKFKITLYQ